MPVTVRDNVWVECRLMEQITGNKPKTRDNRKPLTEYSSWTSTQKLTNNDSLEVYETYIEATEGKAYQICMDLGPHARNRGIQIIIDGVDEGMFSSEAHWRMAKSTIKGRQTGPETFRKFYFEKLKVVDTAHNYKFDEEAHARNGLIRFMRENNEAGPLEFMIGKKNVGTIRVNFFHCGDIGDWQEHKGVGDYKPCDAVDEIGAMKMFPGAKTITVFGKNEYVQPGRQGWAVMELYPYKSFVFHYKNINDLAAQNLLITNKQRKSIQLAHKIFSRIFAASSSTIARQESYERRRFYKYEVIPAPEGNKKDDQKEKQNEKGNL